MKTLSASTVKHIASLANLPVVDTSDYEKKLGETLDYVALLNGVDTKNVPATAQVGNQVNFFRDDKIAPERLIPASKYKSKVKWT